MKNMGIDDNMGESSDDEISAPVFTSEIGKLKDKHNQINSKKQVENENDSDDYEDEGMVVDNEYPSEFSDSEEEKDDYTIRKTDSLVVAATADEDFSNLEIYLYDHQT